MIGNDTDKIIQDFFDLLLRKYQTGLKQSVKAINCFFDYVSGMYYKINLNHRGPYTDCPKWIKNKKSKNKSEQ